MSSVASISKQDSLLPEVAPAACSFTKGNTRLGMNPTVAAQACSRARHSTTLAEAMQAECGRGAMRFHGRLHQGQGQAQQSPGWGLGSTAVARQTERSDSMGDCSRARARHGTVLAGAVGAQQWQGKLKDQVLWAIATGPEPGTAQWQKEQTFSMEAMQAQVW